MSSDEAEKIPQIHETPQMPREPRREVEGEANVKQITSVTPPQKETQTPINSSQPLVTPSPAPWVISPIGGILAVPLLRHPLSAGLGMTPSS